MKVQWNLDLVTLLVSQKTVTKSRVVTKSIAHAYGVSINSKSYKGTKVSNIQNLLESIESFGISLNLLESHRIFWYIIGSLGWYFRIF